jgi:hypothetical protein
MNTEDQNQDFEKLQHLLKLKRYETPPPRYFNDFSGQVTSRIRAGRSGGRYDAFENIVAQTPWLSRLWHKLERQPALSGAMAVIVCGLTVAGVFLMEQTTPANLDFMAGGQVGLAENEPNPTALLGNNFAAATAAPQLVSSTNISAVLTGPNLFENLPMIQPLPVSASPLLRK